MASERIGQLWGYGKGKLGFTVASVRMIGFVIEAGFTPTQQGDTEAHFSCSWTDEMIPKLIKLLRLRIRRLDPTGGGGFISNPVMMAYPGIDTLRILWR